MADDADLRRDAQRQVGRRIAECRAGDFDNAARYLADYRAVVVEIAMKARLEPKARDLPSPFVQARKQIMGATSEVDDRLKAQDPDVLVHGASTRAMDVLEVGANLEPGDGHEGVVHFEDVLGVLDWRRS